MLLGRLLDFQHLPAPYVKLLYEKGEKLKQEEEEDEDEGEKEIVEGKKKEKKKRQKRDSSRVLKREMT